jgi:cell division protein FtsZ
MRGMGKAMMGTGEASGDDRARHAAEAAIANPLLDDVSMHGARGLLISITGGPDLTLYEVDEAASRIREEVDADANIILGATYDPNMTGTIRVAVVATGTDATMVQALEPMKANTSRAPLQATTVRRAMEQAAPQQQYQQPAEPLQLEADVRQAVAEAIQYEPAPTYEGDDGITVEPYIPSAAMDAYDEPARPMEQPVPSVYVPSHAERPEGQRRMPRTEELPAVARKTLVAEERQDAEPRNARALFKRLASNVGIGLRAPQHPGLDETQYSTAEDAAARTAIEAGAARNTGTSSPSEGARGSLDQHGRQLPVKDHIEIPSFLRKHG